ncbi:UNVERIFIED_CONTAM: Zinc finger CCCH domain-containing protein 6 [Sesamum angustifolium]|uniref:Zinc finger CCCH domain-containing protein 6 n=1 Tax=Sesamum angustifolium TaxID=2727405 RepID=A0AAW2L5Z5_9LAMI
MGAQDHLQAKAFSGGMGSDDNLPPGFEGIQPANPWIVKLAQIPLAKWKCPPRFEVDSTWRVVAGEESREIEAQNQREMRVLEAIYPRPSAIPPKCDGFLPSALVGAEDSSVNDRFTPLVPITPIEDEDATLDTPLSSMAANSNSLLLQPQHSSHATFSTPGSSSINLHANGFPAASVEPDIVAAAQVALTSVMSNADQGNLIDRELLIKILSDPKMIEQLVINHATQNAPSSSTQNMPSSSHFHNVPATGAQTVVSSSTQHMPSSNLLPSVGMQNVASSSTPSVHNTPSTSSQYIPDLRSPPKSSFDPVNIAVNRREALSAHGSRPELIAHSRPTATGPFTLQVGWDPFPT